MAIHVKAKPLRSIFQNQVLRFFHYSLILVTYSPRELCRDNCFHNHTNSENRLLTCDLSFAKIMLFVCEENVKDLVDTYLL